MTVLSPALVANACVFVDYMYVSAMRTTLLYASKTLAGGAGSSMLLASLESAFGLGQIGGALTIGRMSDQHGRRVILSLCLACTTVAYGLSSVALTTGSILLLLLSRIPSGVSKQTTTVARAIICDTARADERASALSSLYASSTLGYALGPLLGGIFTERGKPVVIAALAACAFALLTPAVAILLKETRPPPPQLAHAAAALAPKSALMGGAWRSPALRRALLQVALPEAGLVMHTAVAQPLLAQHVGLSPLQTGHLASAAGAAAFILSSGPLPALLRRGLVHERNALPIINGLLLLPSVYLACRPTVRAIWLCLPAYALSVSLQRAMSTALVSKAATADSQGDALGALDVINSMCRVVVPLTAGILATRGSARSPILAMAAIGALGMLAAIPGGQPDAKPRMPPSAEGASHPTSKMQSQEPKSEATRPACDTSGDAKPRRAGAGTRRVLRRSADAFDD